MPDIIKLAEGDVVALKKGHPCGANEWEILGLGVDVKLRCRGCDRVVRIPRVKLERRIRAFVSRSTTESDNGAVL